MCSFCICVNDTFSFPHCAIIYLFTCLAPLIECVNLEGKISVLCRFSIKGYWISVIGRAVVFHLVHFSRVLRVLNVYNPNDGDCLNLFNKYALKKMCTYFSSYTQFLGKKMCLTSCTWNSKWQWPFCLSKNIADHSSAVTKACGCILFKLAYLYYYFDTVHLTEAWSNVY